MASILRFRLTGGQTNSDPNASLGGVMSDTQISSNSMNNLFDHVEPQEAESGIVDYRAIDVYNAGNATAKYVTLYLVDTTSPDTSIEVGVDTTNSPHTPDASLPTIPNELTAPDGITFGFYDVNNQLSLPDIPAGQAVRVWIKRIVNAGATNTPEDGFILTVKYA